MVFVIAIVRRKWYVWKNEKGTPTAMNNAKERNPNVTSMLLYQPALDYVRKLRRQLDTDPDYLRFHSASVSLSVRELLSLSGGSRAWALSDTEIIRSIEEAVVSLRSFEK